MGDTGGDTLGYQNQGDRKVWEEPDPRIKWALDLFDDQGYESQPYSNLWFHGQLGALVCGGLNPMLNVFQRRPYYAGLPITIGAAVFGGLAAHYGQRFKNKRIAEKEAAAMHYIMLHPDRFPEPEMKKFGDKCVLLPWAVSRPLGAFKSW